MSEYGFKLVLLGDEGVGKSSLIVRYVQDKFSGEYISTLGVEFLSKELPLGEDKTVRLIIWDIGGQEQWKKKLNLYLRGADGAVIIVDLTRKATLDDFKFWINSIEKYVPGIPKVLVGNKLDLVDQRKISSEELKAKTDLTTFETSAKTGETVENVFTTISELMIGYKKKK